MTSGLATPSITPDEWDALPKVELWSGPFGDPGHCHNLLDEWADLIRALEEQQTRDEEARPISETHGCVGFGDEYPGTRWVARCMCGERFYALHPSIAATLYANHAAERALAYVEQSDQGERETEA